jgi:hypothetical protein
VDGNIDDLVSHSRPSRFQGPIRPNPDRKIAALGPEHHYSERCSRVACDRRLCSLFVHRSRDLGGLTGERTPS